MAPTRVGLTLQETPNYQFDYDDSLQGTPDGALRTNELAQHAESDFAMILSWFNFVQLAHYNPPFAISVQGDNSPHARTVIDSDNNVFITLFAANGNPASYLRLLLVAEVSELFMRVQSSIFGTWIGWWYGGREGSHGEALSRFITTQFSLASGLGPLPFGLTGNQWMSTNPRQDYVNHPDYSSGEPDAQVGCGVLFLNYLHTQLLFPISFITAAGDKDFGGVYSRLTRSQHDPFPAFRGILNRTFPEAEGTSITPDSKQDNPFPLGSLTIIAKKSTFGLSETKDSLSANIKGFPTTLYVQLEGFNKQALDDASFIPPTFSGNATSSIRGISIALSQSGRQFEHPNDQYNPQKITFPVDISFTKDSISPPNWPSTAADRQQQLDVNMTVLGLSLTTSCILEFFPGADPYFMNVTDDFSANNIDRNIPSLSQDLRVFTATPNENNNPVIGPASISDTPPFFLFSDRNAAYQYIQNLIFWLNKHFSDPNGLDPFSLDIMPTQTYDGDSSITPGTATNPKYNFAIARVRMNGGETGNVTAQNVKVFFRLWTTQTIDTDFFPLTTYPSLSDASGNDVWPLTSLGALEVINTPFFATDSRNLPQASHLDPLNEEYSLLNNRSIGVGPTKPAAWAYFGCFLNFDDPIDGGRTARAAMKSGHHCLVAQIAFNQTPIPIGATTFNSDKLAQRNLNVTYSDNPGSSATHMIPQTFEIRPTDALGTLSNPEDFDELMIDWGNTPEGSIASIYWPQVSATQVLQLARDHYSTVSLSASDAHTIQCVVSTGFSYIPIPTGTGQTFAGLFTIDLPPNVIKGQEFNLLAYRVSSTSGTITPPVRPPAFAPSDTVQSVQSPGNTLKWRYIAGSFQIKIPVSTAPSILPAERDSLAIFKWRLQQTSPTSRWYPVLVRYISYLSARVDGLGGDANEIPASPNGAPSLDCVDKACGKVCRVCYDHCGKFEGFVVRGKGGERVVRCRDEMEERVVGWWRKGEWVCAFLSEEEELTRVELCQKEC